VLAILKEWEDKLNVLKSRREPMAREEALQMVGRLEIADDKAGEYANLYQTCYMAKYSEIFHRGTSNLQREDLKAGREATKYALYNLALKKA